MLLSRLKLVFLYPVKQKPVLFNLLKSVSREKDKCFRYYASHAHAPTPPKVSTIPRLSRVDPSSYSMPDVCVVTFVKLMLTVDFGKKMFHGGVSLTVRKLDSSTQHLILDCRDLQIFEIYCETTNQPCKYTIDDPVEEFGSKLTIDIPPEVQSVITIKYSTVPTAAGLLWLEPQQTAGGEHPFVFSQFEAIAARSFVPCQDTPYVKTKYEAFITAPNDLCVVMSAILTGRRPQPNGMVLYHFTQAVPVPSYLFAIAVGSLGFRRIGPRSCVWAEKELLDAAAYEFADTELKLQTAEKICGPYLWGIFDLLVLPPSFPYGGMENPCLTFVTPTLLAGDRSLAHLVAHEMSHGWAGNLVTNVNFEHFWLNEGFTVFIERKIVGRLEGKAMQDFQAIGGTMELQEAVKHMGDHNPLTHLVPDLTGIHPDAALSLVPYEKGQTLLRYLEQLVGGEMVFEAFLRHYFQEYKYKSLTTDEFITFFESYFRRLKHIKEVDWSTWLYKPGMPPTNIEYDETLKESVDEIRERWIEWDENTQPVPFYADELTSLETIQLLQSILEVDPQSHLRLEKIEKRCKFLETNNSEVKFRWFRIGVRAKWMPVVDPCFDWMNSIGRMKFLRPIYRDMYAWEAIRDRVISNYKENKPYMMRVGALAIARDLGLPP